MKKSKDTSNFTQIPNCILEYLSQYPLSGQEFRIGLSIARWTYGFPKEPQRVEKGHPLSMGYLSLKTGIDRRNVGKILNKLERKQIIKRFRSATFGKKNHVTEIKINTDYSEWQNIREYVRDFERVLKSNKESAVLDKIKKDGAPGGAVESEDDEEQE